MFGIAIAQLKPACSTGRRRRDGGRVRGRSLCKRAAKAVDAKALGYRYEHCRDVAAVLREAFHWLVEARGTREACGRAIQKQMWLPTTARAPAC